MKEIVIKWKEISIRIANYRKNWKGKKNRRRWFPAIISFRRYNIFHNFHFLFFYLSNINSKFLRNPFVEKLIKRNIKCVLCNLPKFSLTVRHKLDPSSLRRDVRTSCPCLYCCPERYPNSCKKREKERKERK